jgi:hypothetical protein
MLSIITKASSGHYELDNKLRTAEMIWAKELAELNLSYV